MKVFSKTKLPRYMLNGDPDMKRFFRKGYPPTASVFDIAFYAKRKEVFKLWLAVVKEVEDLCDSRLSLEAYGNYDNSTGEYTNAHHIQPRNISTIFSLQETIRVTYAADWLALEWRTQFADYLMQNWESNQSNEIVWLKFLLTSYDKTFTYDELENVSEDWLLSFAKSCWC